MSPPHSLPGTEVSRRARSDHDVLSLRHCRSSRAHVIFVGIQSSFQGPSRDVWSCDRDSSRDTLTSSEAFASGLVVGAETLGRRPVSVNPFSSSAFLFFFTPLPCGERDESRAIPKDRPAPGSGSVLPASRERPEPKRGRQSRHTQGLGG